MEPSKPSKSHKCRDSDDQNAQGNPGTRSMDGDSQRRSIRGASPQKPDRKSIVRHLFQIAALAAQASRNLDYVEDSHFALKVLREAHAISKPWLHEVEQELTIRLVTAEGTARSYLKLPVNQVISR